MSLSEKDFSKQVKDLASVFHWHLYHTWTSIHSAKGFPDLVMVKPPRLIFCELKNETGKLTESQEEWGELLKACPGVEYHCWKPSQWETIIELLK